MGLLDGFIKRNKKIAREEKIAALISSQVESTVNKAVAEAVEKTIKIQEERSKRKGALTIAPYDYNSPYGLTNTSDSKVLLDAYLKETAISGSIDSMMRSATASSWRIKVKDSSADFKGVDPEDPEIKKKIQFYTNYFRNPDPHGHNSFTLMARSTFLQLLLFGDAWWEIRDNGYNLLDPSTMRVSISDKYGDLLGFVQVVDGRIATVFKVGEVCHFRTESLVSEFYGMSNVEKLEYPIVTDLYAGMWNRSFFKKAGRQSLQIILPEDSSQDDAIEFLRYYENEYQGVDGAHRTLINYGGARAEILGANPRDIEFTEARNTARSEILSVYGAQPSKMGIQDRGVFNTREQDYSFKQEVIRPLQKLFAECLTQQVLRGRFKEEDLEFVFEDVDLRTKIEESKLQIDLVRYNIITINEARKELGKPAYERGDKLLAELTSDLKIDPKYDGSTTSGGSVGSPEDYNTPDMGLLNDDRFAQGHILDESERKSNEPSAEDLSVDSEFPEEIIEMSRVRSAFIRSQKKILQKIENECSQIVRSDPKSEILDLGDLIQDVITDFVPLASDVFKDYFIKAFSLCFGPNVSYEQLRESDPKLIRYVGEKQHEFEEAFRNIVHEHVIAAVIKAETHADFIKALSRGFRILKEQHTELFADKYIFDTLNEDGWTHVYPSTDKQKQLMFIKAIENLNETIGGLKK